jgi:predicted transcriptional regulator
MTPSLIHENMVNVTWSYNTTLNRINDLTENGYLESHGEKKGWYKISEKGLETVD